MMEVYLHGDVSLGSFEQGRFTNSRRRELVH